MKTHCLTLLIGALAMLAVCSCEKPVPDDPDGADTDIPASDMEEEPVPAPSADLLDVVFDELGNAYDVSANGLEVQLVDGPATVTCYNEDLKMWVSHFNHAAADITSGYYKCQYAKGDRTDKALANGFSMECLFRIDRQSDGRSEWKMFSAMDAGGLGFLISRTEMGCKLSFLANISTSSRSNYVWCTSDVNPQAGRFYHVVGVWDKRTQTVKIYVDGTLRGSVRARGRYHPQESNGAYWFAIGGDAADGMCNSGWKGDVAIARVFSKSLSAKEVKALASKCSAAQGNDGFFCIDNIRFANECIVGKGNSYCIHGDGFAKGDRIRFETIGSDKVFECEANVVSGIAKIVIPNDFETGRYRIVDVRDGKTYVLGKACITIVDDDVDPSGVRVIAHRGLHNIVPENSVAALKAAQDIDADGSEFDIWITTDGHCVVNHDKCFGADPHIIQNSTFRDLSSIRLGNGEPAPTLESYLDQGLRKPSVKLVCEIKSHSTAARNHACFDEAWKLVKARKMENQVIWIAFSWDLCCYIHSQAPSANVQYLCGDNSGFKTPDQVKEAGLAGIDYMSALLDEHTSLFKECREKGIETNVWTVNSETDMVRYICHGIDFITTDKPAELQAILGKGYIERGKNSVNYCK